MNRRQKFESLFAQSAGAVLLALGFGLILCNLANRHLLQPHDPLLGVRMHYLYWAAGLAAIAIGWICLFGEKSWTKLVLVFWVGLNLTLYQTLLPLDGNINGLKGYLGSPADAFGIPSGAAEWILRVATLYLFLGGSMLFLWNWLGRRAYVKISCPECSGHVEFHKSGLGRRIECPHCRARIMLEYPADAALKPNHCN